MDPTPRQWPKSHAYGHCGNSWRKRKLHSRCSHRIHQTLHTVTFGFALDQNGALGLMFCDSGWQNATWQLVCVPNQWRLYKSVCVCVSVWCAYMCVCVCVCARVCGGGVCVCVCMCVRACVTYQTILHLCYKIQLKADGFLQSASVWTWAQKWRTYFPLWNYSGLSHKSITCAPVHVHRYKYCHTDDIITSFIHSLHWHVQNVTIPCHSQECLPFLSVMYPFLPPFSTN